MSATIAITKRELSGYFCTPIAYVFLVVFLVLSTITAFLVGDFFTFNEASLRTFFFWHPWLYLLLVPAVGMRLWSEERRQGTVELLLTMPVLPRQAVLGKFLAGWLFLGLGLLLTFPMPATVMYLGSPDWGGVFTGYLGSLLLGGAFLAICSLASACSRNQVVNFVLSVIVCLMFVLAGHEPTALLLSKWGFLPHVSSWLTQASVIPHLENFQRGILDFLDILYFAAIMVLALRLTQALLELQRGKSDSDTTLPWRILAHPLTKVAILAISLGSLLSILSHFNLSADCTSDRLFSLSPSSRQILTELNRPLTIDFFCAPGQPGIPAALKSHIRRIDDLLAEYQRQSRGRITVNHIAALPDTPEEEAALEAGLSPQTILPNKPELQIYLGLSFSQPASRSIVIPYLNPARATYLEFDITRGIAKLTPRKRAVIAILSPLKILGGIDTANQQATAPWALVDELKDNNFDFIPVPLDTDVIPEQADVLLVVHPRNLPEKTLKAIDRHLQEGKPLAAFLDPACWTLMNHRQAKMRYIPCDSSDLKPLTDAWNITFTDDKVMVDTELATILMTSKGTTQRHLDWLSLSPAQFTEDRATGALASLEMFKAGVFTGTPRQGLSMTTLIHTSSQAQPLLSSATFRNAQDILVDFKPQNHPFPLAIKLQGIFPSPYGQQQATPQSTTAILVGDADLLHDAMSVQRGNQNLQFMLNILDTLSGGDILTDIRNRANLNHPLTKIQELDAAAQRQYQERLETFEKDYRKARGKLMELEQARKNGSSALLTAEQRQQFLDLKRQTTDANRQLRNLRTQMHRNLERLQFRLILANLLLVPTLLVVAGCLFIWKRQHSR